MKKILLTLMVLLTWGALINLKAQDNTPKLMAVKFHADWCKSCKSMGPVFEHLESELTESEVKFVKLDFTNKKTRQLTEKMIAELGLETVVKDYVGTGFILLVEHESKDVKEILNKNHSRDDMKGIIKDMLEKKGS